MQTDRWICNAACKQHSIEAFKLLLIANFAEGRRLSWPVCTCLFVCKHSYKFAILNFVLWSICYYDIDEREICECVYTAMLPVLENALQTSLTVKRLETENSQLKAAIERHGADTKRQGNTVSTACYV